MAGAPWEFYVKPSTIDTIYIKHANADDSTALTLTKGGGSFGTTSFVETNTVEIWADGYQRTTAIVGDDPVTLTPLEESGGSEMPDIPNVPANIVTELNKLKTIKANIKQAIISKGVTVSDSDAFSVYADKISTISETSNSTPEKTA